MQTSGLMLTSMLDILMAILFFLLKNFSYVATTFAVSPDLSLPNSTAMTPPPSSSLNLVVSKKAIMLDDVELVPIVDGQIPMQELLASDREVITKLAQALNEHKKRSLYVAKLNEDHDFTGAVVLQADKDTEFTLLKKVLYTAAQVDFNLLKLAVLRQDS